MKRRKIWVIAALLLMSIGFAAVSTTLYITGNLSIRTNNQDFDDNVVFTKAKTDDTSIASISTDAKTITFNARDLFSLGDEAELEFRVKNKSRQYDAEAEISCNYEDANNIYNEYANITINPSKFNLEAQESIDGKLSIRLVKSFIGTEESDSAQIGFKCTISANAKERNNLAVEVSEPSNVDAFNYIVDLKEAGDTSLIYDGTGDNNLRYVGSDPNNYVEFNGELWRIVGLMNNVEDEYGDKGSYLKIIRNESIGSYAYDLRKNGNSSEYSNDWSTASLMHTLNEDAYFNRTTGLCAINTYPDTSYKTECDFSEIGLTDNAKNMMAKVVWPLGRMNAITPDTKTPSTPLDFYKAERGEDVYEGHNTKWLGYIGLVYVSDLGYSVSGEMRDACLNTNILSKKLNCISASWLSTQRTVWTMNPSTYSSNMFVTGTQIGTSYTGSSYNIVPSVYLYQNVKIMGGMGTKDEPYLLA